MGVQRSGQELVNYYPKWAGNKSLPQRRPNHHRIEADFLEIERCQDPIESCSWDYLPGIPLFETIVRKIESASLRPARPWRQPGPDSEPHQQLLHPSNLRFPQKGETHVYH